MFFKINEATVVDVLGVDAVTILNNLCTANLKLLDVGHGVETFVTEVRGRTLAHGCLFKNSTGFRFFGSPGQAEVLLGHIDRYTIREDCHPAEVESWAPGYLVSGDGAARLTKEWGLVAGEPPLLANQSYDLQGHVVQVYEIPWLGSGGWLCMPEDPQHGLLEFFAQQSIAEGDAVEFEKRRIAARFPWYGVDIDDSQLPQEADRNEQTISFTKGCYLGQETVARLDALGQVQKKIVRWQIDTTEPIAPGTDLLDGEKKVGKITSSVVDQGKTFALGFARRSHFDPGSQARCGDYEATVL
ncbi:putative global regulator [Roseimaritima multifibrata]|uniref:Putative global regulator n=1 Tax=Roseimaritima multifibrata TaxID=1930274 RepID=A0A517MJK8_9BACT|nr:aminomethyltransferase [Roseimaritima multifibrata]QDS95044.1 putative global regulator [Roseimaritima multifibrata]